MPEECHCQSPMLECSERLRHSRGISVDPNLQKTIQIVDQFRWLISTGRIDFFHHTLNITFMRIQPECAENFPNLTRLDDALCFGVIRVEDILHA